MALFPFSISDIDDPEHIRVVLYASGRMGHAPLNALLKQNSQDIERLDKKQSKNITQLSQRIDSLEQQLKTVMRDLENLNKNTKQSGEKNDSEHEDLKIESDGYIESPPVSVSAGLSLDLSANLSVGFAAKQPIGSDFIVSGKDIKF
ncbi:hypothetical protein MEI_00979 [Bartonella vinsonii subsp. arupensis Pm136co]|uniref:Uncharacterized protein n=1 Tax=Bartonella vinsonii subsp. arupensis Pm136co TaxID=1094561 RepID=A0ABP2QX34_BARVI|nr:hypothetical protein [Bartonella vinsonii]EJF98057.1 hypothetical protein MEI_00979 [Bartonella vinsonii subsp. arupensis Pm136co]